MRSPFPGRVQTSAVATVWRKALHVGCPLASRGTAALAMGILAGGLSVAACGGAGSPGAANARPAIRVSGGGANSEFSFTPSEIRVAAGQAIQVEFVNEGKLLHDFSTRGQSANVTLVAAPGSSRSGTFTSDTQGRYEFFCGQAGHELAGMKGTLIVE
jgi:plastocyanin